MQLTLIRGLPGSGKSTLAKTMVEPKAAVHLEADMFFMSESGEYCYQQSKVKAAHAWCESQTEYNLFHGRDVVVSNTFIRRWEMRAYEKLAKFYGAELTVRVCEGSFANDHGVSEAALKMMRSRWQG